MTAATVRRAAPHHGARLWPGAVFLLLLLSGCGAPLQSTKWRAEPPAALAPASELAEVPFFPQELYQCGPAALATVLAWSGVDVDAERLAPQVYVPARKGSLQPELLATGRQYGRVPYVLSSDLDAMLREVAAGHPVLVLQNLGLTWVPRWHYAVVVGYDLTEDRVVLRSGREARHAVSLAVFERTWRRGGGWAVVLMPPARLPATAEELPYLRAVAPLEARNPAAAAIAYDGASRRWPVSIAAWFGLANARYAEADYAAAAAAYRRVLELDPVYAPALNNLAYALAEQGELSEAERYALAAVAAAGEREASVYKDTLRAVRARLAATR